MTYVQNPQEPPPKPSTFRWLLFPIFASLFFASIFFLPDVLIAAGYDPAEMMYLMPTMFALPIGVLVLLAWWFVFSGVPWAIRLGLPVIVFETGWLAAIYTIREVELSSRTFGLRPIIHYKWEPSAEDKLADHLRMAATQKQDLPPIYATVGSEDFPGYRGANFDGVVSHLKLATDWAKVPPAEIWRQPCPGGYSGVAVAGNIVVTLQQRGEREVVVCYDRASGTQRWEFAYDAYWKDVMGNGPRSTPTIHAGRIFTLGATGELVCLDANGKLQWSVNILQDNHAKNVKWGISGSPLIVDDLVVVNAGVDPDANAGTALAAYDQKTGAKKWALSHHRAGYSSPRLATLDGVKQILLFHGDALVGHDPKTGVELWTVEWKTDYDMNSIQPVVVGANQVFVSSEAKTGGTLFRVSRNSDKTWTADKVWHNKKIGARFANPVTDGTHIFCLHHTNGILTCLNVSDGSVKWKGPDLGPGQMLLVGDTLLTTNGDTGAVALFATNSAECTELAHFATFNAKTWNTPALAGDQLFVRNQYEIVCLKLPKR